MTLRVLVDRANRHLEGFAPRYRLVEAGEDLALHVVDLDMGEEVRFTRSLSDGERFLVSLSLALALSGLGRNAGLVSALFIDEGFGSLDAASLEVAIDALESLQGEGRLVDVISHVSTMQDRVPEQIRVERLGAGASVVRLPDTGGAPAITAV